MDPQFPCSSCGACCRRLGAIVTNARDVKARGGEDPFVLAFADFPYAFTAQGHCEKLSHDNKCTVYEGRPLVCDVNRVWYHYFAGSGKYEHITAFYKHNALICNQLIEQDGLGATYMIDVQSDK